MKRILMLTGLCALLLHTSCSTQKKEKHEEEAKFLVSSPVKMDTAITKDYVSQIHSIRHIELRAQERGYLQKIFVDEGQSVKKGQLLFQIMPTLYNAEVQKAKAEADFVKIEYENTKQLADSNIVAPNELALAKAKLDKANAELALANVHLQFTEIRAPYDGIINRFHVRPGSLVDEGELLSSLSDNSQMWVYYNVPEAEYLDYKTNVKENTAPELNLLMANNKIFDETGKITAVEADFDNTTGNIAFRATFPNPKGLLRHGETGSIHVKVPLKNVVLVPQKTTFEIMDKKYVFVVDDKSAVKLREIKIGAELPHLFVVEKGLSENDKILLEGIRKVKDGQEINYDFVKPNSVLSNLDMYAE